MEMIVRDPTQLNYPSTFNNSSIYLQDFRSEPCQVCGENASGWHCGSITCEACKKFFLRSVNEEYLKYKCIREKKCLITRTTRTQCQFCRYAKCIEVGMKLSDETPNPKIEDIFRQIPCAVCQNPSSGIHFGATTCEGCKGFFRRTIKERVPQHYKCSEQNDCEINSNTRNACRACRFRKCLAAGMSIEGSRIGRQSNLFKHKMVEMQRRGLIRSQILTVLASNSNPCASQRANHHNSKRKTSTRDPNFFSDSMLEKTLDKQIVDTIVQIQTAYVRYLKDLPICDGEGNDLWLSCVTQLNDYSARVIDFASQIPGFQTLNIDDKRILIHSSTHSVILVCLCIQTMKCRTLNIDTNWNYLNMSNESSLGQHLQQNYSGIFDLNSLIYSLEKQIHFLQLDDREIALVLTLLIVSIANSKMNDFERLEQLQEEFFATLYDYMSAKRGINSNDYFLLTIQFPLIHRLSKSISSNINNFEYSFSYMNPSI